MVQMYKIDSDEYTNEYILDVRCDKNYKKKEIKKIINESRLYEKQQFFVFNTKINNYPKINTYIISMPAFLYYERYKLLPLDVEFTLNIGYINYFYNFDDVAIELTIINYKKEYFTGQQRIKIDTFPNQFYFKLLTEDSNITYLENIMAYSLHQHNLVKYQTLFEDFEKFKNIWKNVSENLNITKRDSEKHSKTEVWINDEDNTISYFLFDSNELKKENGKFTIESLESYILNNLKKKNKENLKTKILQEKPKKEKKQKNSQYINKYRKKLIAYISYLYLDDVLNIYDNYLKNFNNILLNFQDKYYDRNKYYDQNQYSYTKIIDNIIRKLEKNELPDDMKCFIEVYEIINMTNFNLCTTKNSTLKMSKSIYLAFSKEKEWNIFPSSSIETNDMQEKFDYINKNREDFLNVIKNVEIQHYLYIIYKHYRFLT